MPAQPRIPFGGLPQPPEAKARAAIIPVPLERDGRPGEGASLGPGAVMMASSMMELYDPVLGETTLERGILTRRAVAVDGDLDQVLRRVAQAVGVELEAGRLPVLLGGEHPATLGALEALARRRGTATMVCLDAHLDINTCDSPRRACHGCVTRRALEMGWRVRMIGCRSCSQAEVELAREMGLAPLWAHQIHGDPHWLDRALEGLEGPVYLSLDLDALDPSIMPAVAAPEPGGLGWTQVTELIARLCRRHPLLGLDMMEFSPFLGEAAWDITAARLLYRTLGHALAAADA